ncbi:MAG: Do family serine endopeptidase [Bacteroidia bacterium]|nr:MAG: Do family serine endopeptidase [Bacteroidia bacterium]
MVKKIIVSLLFALLVVSCSDKNNENKNNSSIAVVKESVVEKNQLQLPNFVNLVKNVGNTVVNITAEGSEQNAPAVPTLDPHDPFYDLFKHFAPRVPQNQLRRSMGSGFIISNDGYILTNAHVVDGAKKITVRTIDRQEFSAKLIGIDLKTDIALLKVMVNANNLPTVKIGNPNLLQVGEWVAAIGAPFGFDNSVTQGIVSAKGRSLPNDTYVPFIQSDVPINPGNSGGPLFNLNGEVVAMNSQIYSRSGGYMGISFSIPIDVVMNITNQLKKYGHASHGQLGVQVQPVTKQVAQSFGLTDIKGALVAQVIAGSGAEKAGIKAGDIVLKADGKIIAEASDLPLIVGNRKPGDDLSLLIFRNGQNLTVKVVLLDIASSHFAPTNDATKSDTEMNTSDKLKIERFGFTIMNLTAEDRKELGVNHGVAVVEVANGGENNVAAMAGVMPGDVILAVNSSHVNNINQAKNLIGDKKTVALLIVRGGQQIFITLSVD